LEIKLKEGSTERSLHICEDCLYDIENNTSDKLVHIVETVMSSPLKINYVYATECEICKTTLSEYRKTGKLGCANCFEVFKDKVEILKVEKHYEGTHPLKFDNQMKKEMEIFDLETQLCNAIYDEEFEKAAELRDEIKKRRV
jgi:protein arginine kinase activator